jgi:hypothetical protein
MTTQRKTKRKLSNISFETQGAHIALVSKDQGGPASGADYALVMKAVNFSQEAIEKMQKIRVTMELPEFLRRFFNMYGDDVEVLARMMGYEKEEESEELETYEDYIQSKLQAYEILKSLEEADELSAVLSELDETEYLALLQDQQLLEKAIKKVDKLQKSNAAASKAEQEDTSIVGEVNNKEVSSSVKQEELEKSNMSQEVKTEKEVTVEMVEKAALESIQKAFEEQKQALEKAMQTIAQFEADKKAAIEKARLSEMVSAVKDQAKAEILFKAVKEASDEDFQAVLKTLTEMAVAVEQSELFVEKGASGEEKPVVQESAVAKLLKAKQSNK